MATSTGKKKTENRYPGTDVVPWTVKGTDGKSVTFPAKMKLKSNSFTEYSLADGAARTYTRETGKFAQAVRS